MSEPTTLPDTDAVWGALWAAPGSNRGWLRIKSDHVEIMGEDHDRATIIGARTTPGLGTVITVHMEGGTHWAGRGMRGTHPARVMTFVIRPSGHAPNQFGYVELGPRATASGNAASRSETTARIRTTLIPE
jgi:hypothetical protein